MLPPTDRLGRAVSLEVAGLLAAVAHALLGHLLWAVLGDVTELSAVVALGTLCAIAAHVAIATTRVALHLAVSETTTVLRS